MLICSKNNWIINKYVYIYIGDTHLDFSSPFFKWTSMQIVDKLQAIT